jgi:hypothetical protein
VCRLAQRIENRSSQIEDVTREQRKDDVRRRAFRELDQAIAEAKRLTLAAHRLETTDPLSQLRKTLTKRYGPARQPHLDADTDPDDPVS